MGTWITAIGLPAGLTEYPYPFLSLEAKTGIEIAQSPFATPWLFAAVSLIAVAVDRILPSHPPKRT